MSLIFLATFNFFFLSWELKVNNFVGFKLEFERLTLKVQFSYPSSKNDLPVDQNNMPGFSKIKEIEYKSWHSIILHWCIDCWRDPKSCPVENQLDQRYMHRTLLKWPELLRRSVCWKAWFLGEKPHPLCMTLIMKVVVMTYLAANV